MKLVLGCCASLLALALITPVAHAGPRPPRDTVKPTTPTNLRVVSATEDTLTLSWNASTDNSGSIHHYVVSPGSWHPGNSTTKTITGLVPNYTQTYRVYAVDATGNESALSAPLTATTARDVTPPTAPTALRLTASTPSSVSLAWGASTDRWSLGYRIYMDGVEVGSAASVSTRLRHLPPGTTHTFVVRARDNSGGNLSAPSNALVVTLPASSDVTPPSAPGSLLARDAGDFCGGNILSWVASADDTDPASAIEYEISLNGRQWDLITGGVNAYLYSFGGTNTWTVVAVDRAGNSSAPSNPSTVTVIADPNLC